MKKALLVLALCILCLALMVSCGKKEKQEDSPYLSGLHHVELVIRDYGTISLELDADLLQSETLGELAAALKSLPQQLTDIIVLRYYDGKPLTEIAGIMNLSYGAVKLCHQNAIMLLRQALEKRG